jgi:hypothetical protein
VRIQLAFEVEEAMDGMVNLLDEAGNPMPLFPACRLHNTVGWNLADSLRQTICTLMEDGFQPGEE